MPTARYVSDKFQIISAESVCKLLAFIKYSIASGSIKPNEQLPSYRELAVKLRINPNTVAKVYRTLEAEGIVELRKGIGVFVSSKVNTITKMEKIRIISERIDIAIVESVNLNIEESEFKKIVSDRLKAIKSGKKE